MPSYSYKARDTSGKRVSGTMEGATKAEVIDKLHKMGYMPTSIVEVAAGIVKMGSIFDRLKWISTDDMLLFYIQLSNMISANITILMSLSTLGKQIENNTLREAVANVSRQVEAGSNLSHAFSTEPRIFNRLFINMIKAGEASGKMDTVLMRYADFFEKQEDLKQKIKGALFYPIILMVAGMSVVLLIVTFVTPKFAEIYMKAGISLPVPTQIVYQIGIAIKRYWYLIIGAAVAAFLGARKYFRTERGKFLLDKSKLKMPVIGSVYRKVAVARFSRTLATLLGSGVPILESLDIVRDVVGNEALALVIEDVSRGVEKGERMSDTLKISEEFPSDVVQMVSVGEETGALDTMLNRIADFYDMTVSYAVKKMTTIIEPVFLVITGVMVGCIMASMLLPIFDMIKALRH
ncbi:MAG: type II secretion system F family protein [Candidatus Omnitrophota bacterium]